MCGFDDILHRLSNSFFLSSNLALEFRIQKIKQKKTEEAKKVDSRETEFVQLVASILVIMPGPMRERAHACNSIA